MSRSISYIVTYNNNRIGIVSGLHNSHNAECSTSHFNGGDYTDLLDKIIDFERKNTRGIKKRVLCLNASTGNSNDKWLNKSVLVEKPRFGFAEFFKRNFEILNSFNGLPPKKYRSLTLCEAIEAFNNDKILYIEKSGPLSTCTDSPLLVDQQYFVEINTVLITRYRWIFKQDAKKDVIEYFISDEYFENAYDCSFAYKGSKAVQRIEESEKTLTAEEWERISIN